MADALLRDPTAPWIPWRGGTRLNPDELGSPWGAAISSFWRFPWVRSSPSAVSAAVRQRALLAP